MLRITALVGHVGDANLAELLHDLEHRGKVETVHLSRDDMSRRRQHVCTDAGTDVALMLDRDSAIDSGAVLFLDSERAIVVVLNKPPSLLVRTESAARALELGYFAGNMHWKVKFNGCTLCIALEGPRAAYLKRMAHLLEHSDVYVEPAQESSMPSAGAHHAHEHAHGSAHGH